MHRHIKLIFYARASETYNGRVLNMLNLMLKRCLYRSIIYSLAKVITSSSINQLVL